MARFYNVPSATYIGLDTDSKVQRRASPAMRRPCPARPAARRVDITVQTWRLLDALMTFVDSQAESQPDYRLMLKRMPGANGVQATRTLR